MLDKMATAGFVAVSSAYDIRLFYSVDGPLDASRETIILSNSLAATTHLWDDLVAVYRDKYTIIRYDTRFHGQSPLSADDDFDYTKGHSMEDLANDLITLLDHLKIKRVSLAVGLSMGAGVVLIAGARHPDRFKHVLVVGTKAKAPVGADKVYDARIVYGLEHGSFALGQQSVRRWFPPTWIEANPQKAAAVEAIVGGQSIDGFKANAAALRRLDLWPTVRDIGARADGARFTFVAGEHDSDIPHDSALLADASGSKVVIIRAAGHIVHIQQPKEFYTLLDKILNDAGNVSFSNNKVRR